jgi:large subunit ribosomal protein L25
MASPSLNGLFWSRESHSAAAKRLLLNQGNTDMAKTHEIKAQSRKDEGKGASRRLRHASFVPAVVYGAGKDPESIHNTILLAAKHEWFFSSVLDLNVDGKVQKVLVRDWQKHPFKQLMMHMDFLRINENEVVRISVPVHFLNQETSPAAKTSGIVISHNLTEIEVSCLPKDLPEFIELDLGALKEGDIIHLSQLKLPADVEIPALALGEGHDIAVVSVMFVQEEVDEEPEAAEGDDAAAKPVGDAKAAKPAGDAKKDDKK